MMYTIMYNRTTDHIDGLKIRTESSELSYSLNACGSLTRNGYRMATGKSFETAEEALAYARIPGGRKLCKACEKAAEAMVSEEVKDYSRTTYRHPGEGVIRSTVTVSYH